MKIFSASQLKACDHYTAQAKGITSLQLMENAAAQCANWLKLNMPEHSLYVVLCGTGNNGGDGLAITRMLHQSGHGAKAFVLQLNDTLSEDGEANYRALKHTDEQLVSLVPQDTFIADIAPHIIIIDAILGTGLNKPVSGWLKQFIERINKLPNYKIAIDIPTGLPADVLPVADAAIIKANVTLSFQFYKRSFLHPEAARYTGAIRILDIGLHPKFIEQTASHYYSIDKKAIKEIYKPRDPFTHKGDYGHALVVGGSLGMMGAVSLTAKAALRAGAGKVTGLIPDMGYVIFQNHIPEAMFVTSGENYITEIRNSLGVNASGVGPGLGLARRTAEALEHFIEEQKDPIVLDADALNIISNKKELLHKLPHNTILTPHPKEFERIFGETHDSLQRIELARTQAMRLNIIIVLKDHHTAVITSEGECWYNTTGNAGMATAGSGDVLTGIITSLLAQGYEPENAAILGVYLHGLAGDFAASRHSMEAMIAGDIIEHLGTAFREIK